jgi:hydroxymethylpyrimidine/phosphomethylpyrimidine kinase
MVSSSGTRLLAADAIDLLKRRLVARAAVVTPNLPEAAILLGREIGDLSQMKAAAVALQRSGPRCVVITGGHLAGPTIRDVACVAGEIHVLEAPRLESRSTHGTGCTFAAAIAAGLAQGMAILPAIERARDYVREAIRTAPDFGTGGGPLNHAHPLQK